MSPSLSDALASHLGSMPSCSLSIERETSHSALYASPATRHARWRPTVNPHAHDYLSAKIFTPPPSYLSIYRPNPSTPPTNLPTHHAMRTTPTTSTTNPPLPPPPAQQAKTLHPRPHRPVRHSPRPPISPHTVDVLPASAPRHAHRRRCPRVCTPHCGAEWGAVCEVGVCFADGVLWRRGEGKVGGGAGGCCP